MSNPVQAAGPAPAAGQVQVAFALTPGQATKNNVLNYATSEGIKQYKSATRSLYTSDDDKFDCDAAGLRDFLQLLEARATSYAWDVAVLDIALDPTNLLSSERLSLLTRHGELTMEQVKAHCAAYIDTPTRAAQDSMQVYECLMQSLSKIGREKITVWKEQYYIGEKPSGALFLKTIIRESHSDTKAQAAHIRHQLSSLDTYMASVGSDIDKFNIKVRTLIQELKARGETSNDLLINLFKGYKAAADSKFVEYIEKREDEYEDGEEMNPEILMTRAANKYKTLLLKDKWMAPSAHEEKVLALEAKIKVLSAKRAKAAPSKDGGNSKGKVGNKKKQEGRRDKEKPAWMFQEPVDKNEVKIVDGKKYYWCPNHKCWTRHKPSECKGKGFVPSKGNNKKDVKKIESKRELKLAKAAESLFAEDDEE